MAKTVVFYRAQQKLVFFISQCYDVVWGTLGGVTPV